MEQETIKIDKLYINGVQIDSGCYNLCHEEVKCSDPQGLYLNVAENACLKLDKHILRKHIK